MVKLQYNVGEKNIERQFLNNEIKTNEMQNSSKAVRNNQIYNFKNQTIQCFKNTFNTIPSTSCPFSLNNTIKPPKQQNSPYFSQKPINQQNQKLNSDYHNTINPSEQIQNTSPQHFFNLQKLQQYNYHKSILKNQIKQKQKCLGFDGKLEGLGIVQWVLRKWMLFYGLTLFFILLSLGLVFPEIVNKIQTRVQKQFQNIYFHYYPPESPCPIDHTIIYTWLGNKPIPKQYQDYLTKCHSNVKLLTNQDFQFYITKWNNDYPNFIIDPIKYQKVIPFKARSTFLRKIYLYYQSGIYSDFDTIINQTCFKNIESDQIIFTNVMMIADDGYLVPEENFMYVKKKYNQQMKRMIIAQIYEIQHEMGNRWDQCKQRQCLISMCQYHRYDKIYDKI